MIKLEEQPIVKPEDYLFNTWVKGNEIIKTEKGNITVLELLTDFKSHILQNVEHNKEAYHQAKQCAIHGVSNLLSGSFDADLTTSSATKCKCGREKWEHPKAT